MLETNIRIVRPGNSLSLPSRCAVAQGPNLTADLLQRACGILRYRHGLAAVPHPHDRGTLIVSGDKPIPELLLEGEDWTLTLRDSELPTRELRLSDQEGQIVIPDLIERLLLVQLARRTKLRTLDSPRKWYERNPFKSHDGIAAYRRFEVGSVLIDSVGVGIAVDIGTAFFTEATLDYFFASNVSSGETRRRLELFEKLTGRQRRQKGTLLYDTADRQIKCYFEDAPDGVTCATTGPVRARGRTFPSLFEYSRVVHPRVPITEDTPAVRVSFPGLERAQFVAADRLRVRVMNDDVQYPLNSIDKIDPPQRRQELITFWNSLEPTPLGYAAPAFCDGFWQPDPRYITRFAQPALHFGRNQVLREIPPDSSNAAHREHYEQRLEHLRHAGCYYVPPTAERTLYFAYPQHLDEHTQRQLAKDLTAHISTWTGLGFTAKAISYSTVQHAVEQLRGFQPPAVAVFILNEEPAAYYEVAFQLAGWRIKRITERELLRHYGYLTNGLHNGRQSTSSPRPRTGRWHQFVIMNGLGVLQLLDCVPWRVSKLGPYEAQVAIDVGYDRRYFAVSLLIARQDGLAPPLWIDSVVMAKPDHQHEAINPVMLADALLELFRRTKPLKFDPLASLLIFRDGQSGANEIEALFKSARPTLVAEGYLKAESRLDIVDFHKKNAKPIRLWEAENSEVAANTSEGCAVKLRDNMVVVVSTGAATLRQGTAQPFVLVSRGESAGVIDAAHAAFHGAQMNFSSPRVAQRLPLTFERTDEELAQRAAQEIRRFR